MNYIVAVLKSGGDFIPEHVEALRKNVAKHLTVQYEFILFTNWYVDTALQVEMGVIPLEWGWRGWWSKIELFRPDIEWAPEDRIVYMDLDTVLIGNIDWLFDVDFSQVDLMALRGFNRPRFASGLMGWQGTPPTKPFDLFKKDPQYYMRKYLSGGDQKFIYDCLFPTRIRIGYWQEMFLDKIYSYKLHLTNDNKGNPPGKMRLVCFHGKPRPWDANESWIEEARA